MRMSSPRPAPDGDADRHRYYIIRLTRFSMRICFVEPPEIVEVENPSEEISCDGGDLFGHPRVYLSFAGKDYVDCYYCGRRFIRSFAPPESGAA